MSNSVVYEWPSWLVIFVSLMVASLVGATTAVAAIRWITGY